jgi:L-erythro-3,5-diaminohexanoate dehydrogenase
MLIGNGYLPGHAEFALNLLRAEPGVHALFTTRDGHTRQP